MQLLVNIDVEDLERGIAFYETALSLQLSRRLFDGEVAELVGASSTIYLLRNAAGTQAVAGGACRRDYHRHWTPVHLDFVVDDLDLALRRATSAGAGQERPAASYPWGRLATLSDPFGNGFCLIQFSGKTPYEEQRDAPSPSPQAFGG